MKKGIPSITKAVVHTLDTKPTITTNDSE